MRAALAVLALASIGGAQDWPQFLGPSRDGVYAGKWSVQSTFAKVWSRSVGQAYSAPVVAGGRVILYHRTGGEDKLESLDAVTGKTAWTYSYPTDYRDDFGFGEGPRSTPLVDSDRIYIYSAEGVLQAVDAKTGKKVWGFDARERFGTSKEFFGTACSPIMEGKLLLMNVGGRKEGGIVALDKATGTTVWAKAADEAGYSSPVVATIGGSRHALFFTRTGLVDVEPATGRIRFTMRWRSRQGASVNAATPLVSGNLVFVSASYSTGATVVEIQGDQYKQLWSGDDSLSNHYSTSVLKDGYVYGYHGRQEFGQSLRCIELKTGKVMWSSEGFGAGTVTLAGEHLLLVRENGELTIAAASPKAFQAVRKMKLMEGTVRAYPALAAGRLYVRTDDTLSSFVIE